MKKDGRDMKYVNYLCVWCLAMVLFACQEESLEQSGKTGFLVSLTDGMEVAVSRATPGELKESLPIEAKDFDLTITGSSTGETAYSGKVSEGLIPVKAGVYNLTATYGENPVLALDAPYFKGEVEKAIVRGGETTSVEIPCKVANSLLSVTFDNSKESFEDIYSDYSVEVKVGEESVTLTKDGKESAYFRADSGIEVIFHGTLKEDEGVKTVSLDLSGIKELPLQAGDHLKLTLMPELDKYDIPLSVEAAEVVTVTLEETIPLSWLPKPKVGGFNEDGAKFVSHVETSVEDVPAVLNFSGEMAIQDVELTLDLKDEDFTSLNKTYLLSSLTEEDKIALSNAGIVLPELGAVTGSIDFSALVRKLKIVSGNETVHSIKLRVKANERWSSEEDTPDVFEIHTLAPKVVIAARPEDVWSKSLTVSGITVESGDEATIKGNLKYQFNDNGTWKDCEGNVAMMANHPSDSKMQVRAVYRNVVECEPTVFDLEVPEQLPNSDMEEWSYETYTGDRYSFNPWNDGGTPFWDTNNDYTTRHRNNSSSRTMANYNGFHAVSYVQGRNGGLAAELRSTANGRANTRIDIWGLVRHDEKDYNKVAGKLFTGTTNVTLGWDDSGISTTDSYDCEKNASFPSRPTALQFYYKYVPYTTDSWNVHIELLDENKNVIIQNEKTSSKTVNDWSEEPFSVELDYADDTTYAKCKYIYVVFKSTINEGANMPYREITQTFYVSENGALSAKTYSPAYVGSVLTIDDISLVYDK